jgi:hypothetical protein
LISAAWEYPDQIPTVAVRWKAGESEIKEDFFVPADGGLLFRAVTIRNLAPEAVSTHVTFSMVPSFAVFDDIGTDARARVVYARGFTSMKLLSLEKQTTVSGRYEKMSKIVAVEMRAQQSNKQ